MSKVLNDVKTLCYQPKNSVIEQEEIGLQVKSGDYVKGIINKKDQAVYVQIDDKEYRVSNPYVNSNVEEQELLFKVKRIEDGKIELEECIEEQEVVLEDKNVKKNSIPKLESYVIKSIETYQEDDSLVGLIEELEEEDLLKIEENIPIKKQDKSQIKEMIKRIQSQREFKERQLAKQIEKQEQYSEQVNSMAIHLSLENENQGKIVDKLKEYDIPVTEENIQKLEVTYTMLKDVDNLKNVEKVNLLHNSAEITIENLYKAANSLETDTTEVQESMSEHSVWNSLEKTIKTRLKNMFGEVNQRQFEHAKWLFENNLPVEKNTIESLDFINNTSTEEMENICLRALKQNKNPYEINLVAFQQEDTMLTKAVEVVDKMSHISMMAVDYSIANNMALTINSLYEVELSHPKSSFIQEESNETQYFERNVITKRQLEEIRLKLTVENAYKMYQQGIQVELQPISSIVEQLKEEEIFQLKELNRSLENRLTIEEQIKCVDINTTVQIIKNSPCDIIYNIVEQRGNSNFNNIYELGSSKAQEYEKLKKVYEPLMTKPSLEYHDHIEKAFEHLDSIIKEWDIEDSEQNRKAIRILAYNQMPITKESIEEVKYYDTQVVGLLEELSPNMVMKLIQNGQNPLDFPLDELQNLIDVLKDNSDKPVEEKFSSYLYQIEKAGDITEEEKESFIGICRLLHQIAKKDNYAVASVIARGQEITLNNLYKEAKLLKNKQFDQKIEEEQEYKVWNTTKESSIVNQIEKGFANNENWNELNVDRIKNMLKKTEENWGLETYLQMNNKGKEVEQFTLEELYHACNIEKQKQVQLKENLLQQFEQVDAVNAKVEEILKNYKLPSTIENIIEIENYINHSDILYNEVKQILKISCPDKSDQLEENMDEHLESFIKNLREGSEIKYSNIDHIAEEIAEELVETDSLDVALLQKIYGIRNSLRMSNKLQNQGYYDIPMKTEKGYVNLKLQIVQGQEEVSNVKIKFNGSPYGSENVEIEGYLIREGFELHIMCEEEKQVQFKLNENVLKDKIEEMGLTLHPIQFNNNQKIRSFNLSNDTINKESNTRIMYELATELINYLQEYVNLY